MPAVADLPQKPSVVFPLPIADAFGDEGEFVSNRAAQVVTHWEDRAEWLLNEVKTSDEEFQYTSVPLKIVGNIQIRCHFVGPLKPTLYSWDE
ncbi:MAG: hypothetical protein AB7I48_17210 [Planctomycetaceae bacterium]